MRARRYVPHQTRRSMGRSCPAGWQVVAAQEQVCKTKGRLPEIALLCQHEKTMSGVRYRRRTLSRRSLPRVAETG